MSREPSAASQFPHRLHGAPSNDYSSAFFHHLVKVNSWIQQEEFEAALTNSAWGKGKEKKKREKWDWKLSVTNMDVRDSSSSCPGHSG